MTGTAQSSERCQPCRNAYKHETRQWTPETILAAIQRWADDHGGVPPVATDWNVTLARRIGQDKPDRGRDYPPVSAVQREFDSWHAAITAAGFDAFTAGHCGRDGEYPEVIAETIMLYRRGLSQGEVARRLGVTPHAVRHRLLKAGEPIRPCPWHWRSQERQAA